MTRVTGSFSADGVSDLLENLNIEASVKNDTCHLDIETALESLKYQVEIHIQTTTDIFAISTTHLC